MRCTVAYSIVDEMQLRVDEMQPEVDEM